MVGDKYKQGIVEPWLGLGVGDKLADRVVAIFDRCIARRANRPLDPAIGKGVGTMIGGGHHMRKHAFTGGNPRVDLANRQVEQILVGNTPNVLVADVLFV